MKNLIAYMPVLNQLYINWLNKYPGSRLFLVDNSLAEELLPVLQRNMVAISTDLTARVVVSEGLVSQVDILSRENVQSKLRYFRYIMPDDELSHLLVDKYLNPSLVDFEPVWGRWDMSAVKRKEPVLPDLEVSSAQVDRLRMEAANRLCQKSPDWWRQIGAIAFRGDQPIAAAYNRHYPNEYETMIFGDPRIVFQAGDPAGAEVYLSLHAERGIIAACAREGISLNDASVYVTTFPCGDCARMLAECHIKELFFQEGYSVLKGLETLRAAGVRIVKVN